MWRSAVAAGSLFIATALAWALHDPFCSYWEVRALGTSADPVPAEAALWSRGRGAVWALRRGLAAEDARTRLRCARLLALVGDQDADRALYAALREGPPEEAALAERLLQSVWDLRKGPTAPEELEVLRRSGESRTADPGLERDLDQLLSVHPGWVSGYAARAHWALENGDLQSAMQDALTALRLEPDHFGAARTLGRTFLKLGFPERARECFEHALAVNPRLDREELEQARKETDAERERRLREHWQELPVG